MKFALGAAAITGASALIYLLLRRTKPHHLDPGKPEYMANDCIASSSNECSDANKKEKDKVDVSIKEKMDDNRTKEKVEDVSKGEKTNEDVLTYRNYNGHVSAGRVTNDVRCSDIISRDSQEATQCFNNFVEKDLGHQNLEKDFSVDDDLKYLTNSNKSDGYLKEKDFSLGKGIVCEKGIEHREAVTLSHPPNDSVGEKTEVSNVESCTVTAVQYSNRTELPSAIEVKNTCSVSVNKEDKILAPSVEYKITSLSVEENIQMTQDSCDESLLSSNNVTNELEGISALPESEEVRASFNRDKKASCMTLDSEIVSSLGHTENSMCPISPKKKNCAIVQSNEVMELDLSDNKVEDSTKHFANGEERIEIVNRLEKEVLEFNTSVIDKESFEEKRVKNMSEAGVLVDEQLMLHQSSQDDLEVGEPCQTNSLMSESCQSDSELSESFKSKSEANDSCISNFETTEFRETESIQSKVSLSEYCTSELEVSELCMSESESLVSESAYVSDQSESKVTDQDSLNAGFEKPNCELDNRPVGNEIMADKCIVDDSQDCVNNFSKKDSVGEKRTLGDNSMIDDGKVCLEVSSIVRNVDENITRPVEVMKLEASVVQPNAISQASAKSVDEGLSLTLETSVETEKAKATQAVTVPIVDSKDVMAEQEKEEPKSIGQKENETALGSICNKEKSPSPSDDCQGKWSYKERIRNARGITGVSVLESEAEKKEIIEVKENCIEEAMCLDLDQAEKELCSLIDDSQDDSVTSFVVQDKSPASAKTESLITSLPVKEISIIDSKNSKKDQSSSNNKVASPKKSSKSTVESLPNSTESSKSRSYKDRVRNTRGNSSSEVGPHNNASDNNRRNLQSTESSQSSSSEIEPETLFNPSSFPVTNQEQYIFYEFEIPQMLVGRLIGRKGAFVNKIKATTDAAIVVGPHKHRRYKMCSVEGTRQQVDAALDMIREYFPLDRYPELTLEQVFNRTSAAPPVHATINTQAMQIELALGVVVEVRVSAVVSGNELWVQQPLHPSYSALQRLHACMNLNYVDGSTTPQIPTPIMAGTVCVAQINSEWLRSQVLSATEDTAIVVLLDIGGTMSLPIAGLRQIRYDYMTLPFQASQCLLHGIQPISDEGWDESSAVVLEELVSGTILSAAVVSYTQDGVPLVNLYRRDQNEYVYLNERLVNFGHARWISSAPSS